MDNAPALLTAQQVSADALRSNVQRVLDELAKNRFENSQPARLIAVTKTVTPEVINQLKPLQILDIGENRAQVAMPKMPELEPDFRLHWIGRLQTNKVKYIIDSVYMLHTLDRLALAQEVQRRAAEHGRIIPALVQVNISGEEQKGGMPPDEVLPFLRQMRDFSNIRIQGLMSIMPAMAGEEELTRLFRGMRLLFDQLRQEAVEGVEMRELSMGMSGDYTIAAREGATMVRIGTALYQPLAK
jgi:pyridoxal phosphate enzyme (YggS family)